MSRRSLVSLSPAALLLLLASLILSGCGEHDWEQSLVRIEVSRKAYHYFRPWETSSRSTSKVGVVIRDHQILSTADGLSERTLVRIQKQGRGKKYDADVVWIDYHANLALLEVEDEAFWRGLQPAPISYDPPEKEKEARVYRWNDGGLEAWKGEVNRIRVRTTKLSYTQHVFINVNSDIDGAGWSEAVTQNGRLIGLTSSKGGDTLQVIPSTVIFNVLRRHHQGAYKGMGYFPFFWQEGTNPANLTRLGLDEEPRRGIIITHVLPHGPEASVLKKGDIILEVEGFPIETNGDYDDPDYGNLSLENLAVRNKSAGDTVGMTVWRGGKRVPVEMTLPQARFDIDLVPDEEFDHPPEYLMAGGLVFQPLSNRYLRSWGEKWREASPFRLYYYNFDEPTPERPKLVILSQVIPDPYNLGYQNYRHLVVDKINSRPISTLSDVSDALLHPEGDYHIIEFMHGKDLQKLVLDATTLPDATLRIMERWRISDDRHILE